MTFGQKLRFLRNSMGWSMTDFIERFNDETGAKASKGRLSMWENDKNDPSFRVVQVIAKMFNISVDYFADDAGSVEDYRKNDVNKIEVNNAYSELSPRRQSDVLDYVRKQKAEQSSNEH